eukprot:CAMPEP_0198232262 /NCGR_PEP_ID=MMETSP1445-20131203/115640_1 /TAXON_ID=36898 /ORGANISM="Pyramimonas sp., Strain CCMP2087" /LENGTH=95 /DNA_ID=CAMNT_0043912927 /DNA_START=157 /DNA_END=444 /DNA_ORIENTATION=+
MGGLAGAPLLLLCGLSAVSNIIMDDDATLWLRADIVLVFCGTTTMKLCYYYTTARARDDVTKACIHSTRPHYKTLPRLIEHYERAESRALKATKP